MSSTINASTASGGGVITSADASGILQLQTGGVTGITIDASQNVVLAKGLTVGATAAPAFSAYASVAQSIPSAVPTKIIVATKEFDTNSNFDAVTNYRFTPTVAGYYQADFAFTFNSTGTGAFYIALYKNGVSYKTGAGLNGTSINPKIAGSALTFLNGSTDYIEAYVYQNSGGAISGYAAQDLCYFQAFLARSA